MNGGTGDDSIDGGTGSDSILAGDGNDTIVYDAADVLIDGQAGTDTLLVNDTTLDLTATTDSQIKNIEIITLNANTAQTLSLNGTDVAALLASDNTKLLINGTTGDQVSFKDSWVKNAQQTQDGVTYNVYTQNTLSVWVEETISAEILIEGTTGDDTVSGGEGDDTVSGGEGNDTTTGGAGNDSVSGDAGDDTTEGGDGDDTVDGGAGNDSVSGDAGDDTTEGGDGDDTVDGGTGNDTVSGGEGNDTTTGGAGNDSVSGDAGDDTTEGGDGDDTVDGGAGNDTVSGGEGNDSTTGGAGNDSVSGDAGDDTTEGGDGDDTVDGGTGNDTVDGGTGNDTVSGGEGNDSTTGGAGNDSVLGDAGDDTTEGGDGDDTVDGGAGNDTVSGGEGNDSTTGGAGNDSVSGDAGDDTTEGGDGDDTVDGGAGNDTVSGGEGNDSTTGGAGNDSVLGDAGDDTTEGGDGDDTVDGGTGNDTVSGGEGNDTTTGGAGNDSVSGDAGDDTTEGGDGDDTVDGGTGNDTVSGGEGNDSTTGGAGNDSVSGDAGDDTTEGGDGDDSVDGGTGNDTVSGGEGNDSTTGGAGNDSVSGDAGDDTTEGGDGDDTVDGGTGNDTVSGGEGNDSTTGGAGNDSVSGDAGDDTAEGGDGDDTVDGGTGNDTVSGGEGNDSTTGGAGNDSVSGDAGDDTTEGGDGDDTVDGGTGNDTVSGGEGNDTTTGGAGNDSVSGDAGDDTTEGGDGDDTVDGGTGNDTVSGGEGNDSTTGGAGNDSVSGDAGDDTTEGGDGNDTVDGGAGNDSVSGDAGDDTLSGGLGDDTLNGGDGDDSIDGGTGADSILGGSGNDTIVYDAADILIDGQAGTDTLLVNDAVFDLSTTADTQIKNIEHIVLNSDDAQLLTLSHTDLIALVDGTNKRLTITGGTDDQVDLIEEFSQVAQQTENGTTYRVYTSGDYSVWVDVSVPSEVIINSTDGADSLEGTTGDDSIEAQGGNDTVTGDAGDDTLAGDAGDDSLSGGTGNDSVLGGTGNDTVLGDAGDDTLDGGAGNDSVDGGAGNDSVAGGEGDDTVSGGTGDDSVDGGSGDDSVDGGVGNDTVEGGLGNDTVNGGAGNDSVNGGDGDDSLNGGAGNDTVSGGAGNDSIDGGLGADSLLGGDGNDTIVLDINDVLVDGGEGTDTLIIKEAELDLTALTSPTISNVEIFDLNNPGSNKITLDVDTVESFTSADNELTINGSDRDIVDLKGNWTQGTPADGYFVYTSTSTAGNTITLNIKRDITIALSREGSSSADVLDGTINADILFGLGGDDTISGFAGDDTISGGTGDDVIDGGTGADTATYSSETEDLTIDLTSGTSQATDNTVTNVTGSDTFTDIENIEGGAGNDQITGDSGFNALSGGAGNDTINAGAEADTLSGGAGDDKLYGEAGNDRLSGQAGDDTLDGGAGTDTADYSSESNGVTVELQNNTATDGNGDTDTLNNIENIAGGDGNDNLTGDTGINVIDGSGGDDTINGGTGNDTLKGGTGSDTLSLAGSVKNWVVNLFSGDVTKGSTTVASNTAVTGTEKDTLSDFENIQGGSGDDALYGSDAANALSGGAGSDELIGNDGADTLSGEAGDDILKGGAGNDVLDGGTGIDEADYSDTNANVTANLANNTASSEQIGTDALTSIENIRTGSGADTITGDDQNNELWTGAGSDTINAGSGDDSIHAGAGDDQVDGGDGIDTIIYDDVTGPITIDLVAGTAQGGAGSNAGLDTLSNIENIIASGGADTITGDSNDNRIDGAASSDTIDAGAGNDTVVFDENDGLVSGGAGNDTLTVGAGVTLLDLTVTRNEVFTQFETIDISADGAQIIKLSDADIRALSGDGTSTTDGTLVIKGTSADSIRLVGANWPTQPTKADGSVADQSIPAEYTEVIDGITYEIYAYNVAGGLTTVKVQQGISVGFIFVSGEEGDVTQGTDGSDEYTGNGGNDTFVAGDGDDSGNAGSGDDSIVAGGGNDTIQGGTGNDTIFGGDNPDTIGSGDDSIDAGAGDDSVIGGDGNDTLVLGDGDDTVDGGIGNDDIDGGKGADQINAGAGDDTILGGEGDDYIDAGAGDDSVNAGIGNDTVVGGPGNDTLQGGSGVDTLDYTAETQSVTVNLTTGVSTTSDGDDTTSDFENVLGGAGNDTLTGNNAANFIDGKGGSDSISTGLGNDTVIFDSNDTVDLGEGIDTLTMTETTVVDFGAIADDQFVGIEEIDLTGNNGQSIKVTPSDVIAFSNTTNTIKIHGDAADSLTLTGVWTNAGVQPVSYQGQPAQTYVKYTYEVAPNVIATVLVDPDINLAIEYIGTGSDDSIVAGSGDDTVSGLGGNDTLDGGEGADTILGGAGDDLVIYDVLDTSLDGGDGDDTLAFATDVANEILDLTETARPNAGGTRPAINNFETIDITGNGDNTVIVSEATVLAQSTNNAITIEGNAGDKLFISDNSSVTWTAGTSTGGYTTWTSSGGATITVNDAIDVVQAIVGTPNDDALVSGDANDNLVRGLAGDDTLDGGAGADVLRADEGDDDILFDANDLVIDGGTGNDTLVVDNENIDLTALADSTIQNIEFIDLVSSSNPATLTANAADIRALNVNAEVTVLGDASDSVALVGNWTQGSDDGTYTTYSITVDDETSTINVANAIPVSITYTGTNLSDDLISGAGDQTIIGLRGNDELDGGLGADTLDGGVGEDILVFDINDALIDGGAGVDVLRVKGSNQTLDLTELNNSVIQNIENIDITGSGNNTAVMSADDVQALSSTTDTIIVTGNAGDSVRLAGSGWEGRGSEQVAGITYNKYIGYSTDGSQVIVLSDLDIVKGDQVVGDDSTNDSLEGGVGSDELLGLGGDDTLDGSAGSDLVYGGDGDDTVIYDAVDAILHGGNDTDTGGAQDNDTLLVDTNDQIIDLQETVRPTEGAIQPAMESFETIDLTGTGGNYLILDDGAITDLAGASLNVTGDSDDIVFVDGDLSNTLTLTGGVTQKAVITNDGDSADVSDNLTGTAGQDAIKAGVGDDTLDGGAGADILYGQAGNDTIVYDVNDLRVFGGAGTDTLIIKDQDTVDGGANNTNDRLNTTSGDVDLTIVGLSTVDGIEVLSLNGNGNQTVRLDEASVLSMSDSGKMTVKGDVDDVVKLYGTWVTKGIESDLEGKIYNVFENDGAVVSVSEQVTVSIQNELGGQIIMGTTGSDDTTITEFGDGASSGDGDDIIRITNLNFTSVDGGRGYDRVYFELDATSVINTALLSASSITTIEEIHLGQDNRLGDANADNAHTTTLILTPEKVAQMTDDNNILVVEGASNDEINLYGSWSDIDFAPVVNYNGNTYKELVAENGAVVYYNPSITVTAIDPTLQMTSFSVAYDDGAYLVSSGIDRYAGWRVENAGDINKDGIDDIIVNAVDGAYLVFGTESMSGQIDLANLSSRGVYISGNDVTIDQLTNTGYQNENFNQYNFGFSAIGDVNGDGIADIATTTADESGQDVVTIMYGRTEWESFDLSNFTTDSDAGYKVFLPNYHSNQYTSVQAVGDINNDGYADFAIGNAFGNNYKGEVFVIFGGEHNGDLDTSSASTQYIKLLSDNDNITNIGVDISALGDVNSDGFADFIVGGPNYLRQVETGYTTDQIDYSGSAHIIFGKENGWADTTVLLQDTIAPLTTNLTPSNNQNAVNPNSNLTLDFNEPIKLGESGTVSIYRVSDDSLIERFDVATGLGSNGGQLYLTDADTLAINPVDALSGNTSFYVTMESGAVVDYAGNAYAGITASNQWVFTTTDSSNDVTAPAVDFVILKEFGANDVSYNADTSTDYWGTLYSDYTDLTLLAGSYGSADIKPIGSTDISSGPEYSTNSANAENSFRMYFEFSETVKTTGSIVIKDATGTVMESYDLSTGEGSLGGGIRTDNIPARNDYNPVAAEINADTSQFVIDLGFTFTANTQYSVEFVGIEDLAGNAINTSTQNFNFTTSATDVVAPQVVAWNLGSSDAAFNTSSNYSTTAVDADIVFKASESLIPDTVGSIVLQVRNGSAVETFDWDSANGDAPVFADGVYTVTGSLGGTLTISGQTVTINAGQNLDYSTTYSVSASGLSDPNGNAFAMNTTSYYFSTITSAEAVAFVGGNTFTHVSTVKLDDAVTIEFAEDVIAGRTESGVAAGDTEQYIKLWNVDGVLVETFAVSSGSGDKGGELSFNANTVSLNAGGNLTYATGYYVTLDAQAIQAATENVSEDAGNVDGDTISTRYVTLTDMDNADTPLNFATEAGSQIDPGWILTPSSDANGDVGDDNASRQWLNGEWSAFPGQNVYTYRYLSVGEWAGQQVEAVGDVDGDGIVDFIIGSPNKVYDPSLNPTDGGDNYVYGKYYLVFGEAGDWDSFVNIPEKIALGNAVEIYGTIDNWIQSVSEFGDLNNDGFMDILVNAGGVYPDTGTTDDKLASDDGDTDSGASFVIYGRDRDDWNTSVNVTQLGEQGLEITGGLPQEQLGFSSASGDFNGDGTIDLLFGMPRNDRDGYASGEGFVINGGDFSDSLMSVGTANADTLLGDFDADRLAGQQGNDTIYGLGGADILRGGEGDDVIGLTDLDFILLDGGTNTNSNTGGGDTLRFIGNGINLDFTGYAGANIRSFERIDLTGDGNNEITLNYREVTGLLERQLSTSYGENTTLVVDGNTGDKINLEGPWQKINSDNTYDHYALDGVVVKVDATITVNQPSWTIPYQGATLDLNAANLPEGFRTDIIEHSATLNNGDRFADTGYVTAIGDVNNDGFADFAVTDETSIQEYLPRVVRSVNTTDYNNYNVDRFSDYVPFYGSVNYQTGVVGYVSEYVSNYTLQTGNVYIVYGQADGIGSLDLDLSDNSTVTKITGSMNDNFASYAGSLGDVTGDGIADFIIGAPSSNNTIKFNEGAEQLYTDIDGSNTSLTTDAGYYDGVNAASATALAGVSISHDSWSFDNAGRQYFFFGGNTNLVNNVSGAISTNTITNDASDNTGNHDGFPTTTDSADSRVTDLPNNGSGASTTTYQITPTSTLADLSVANQNATWSPISVGDVNGDGFDDFIDSAGSGVLYFGQSLSGGIDESVTWHTLDLGNFNRINGAGDIDGDGYADLLLGSGAVNYIVFGQADGWLAAPSFGSTNAGSDTAPAVTRIIGEAGYSSPAGSYTTLGDINGDGFNDILIAGNPANNYDAKSNGAAYVIFGSASDADVWDTDISLENLAANGKGFRITGAVDFDLLTSGSWTGVGDMNGDGFADFMLSSPGDAEGDLNATSGSGSSYLFLGQNQIEWQDINASEVQDYGIQILGTGQGVWTALGDIDGDGLDDVALANTTATQIFYGSTNLSVTKDNSWSQLGNQTTVVQTVTEQSGDVLTATRGDNAVAIYGQDRLIGNIGNDTLIGDGGADVLIGGAGDDTLSITDANVFHVDGGEGVDTLVLNGAMAFDLTQISNNAISKIEILLLDNAIQTVTLTEADVRAMTKDTNTAVDDVDYQLGNVLVINSNDTSSSTDVVNLIGADWQDTGVDTSVNGTGTYSIYQASGNNVYVVISDAITPTITNVTQTITDTSGNDALYGSIAADDITATDGNDTLYGQAGMDTLTGGNGSDDLYGGAGNDSIDAGDGDDEIYAGTGDDTIDGGAGYDELDYSTTNDDLTITYATTANQGSVSGATIGTDTYVGIENVIGGTGNDTFVGSTSTDDSLSYASINGAVQVDFSGANVGTVNTVNAGVDTFTGMETIIGSNSNDTFNGVTGGVAVDGLGGGSDRLSYIDSSAAVTITFAADSDTSGTVTGNANATFINVEHVQGSTAADVIDGSAISNNLSIYVLGSEGDDTITGGAGSADALAYQAYTVDITADLTAGTVLSSVGNDTVSDIEEINTGSGNDDITGTVGNDIIRGNAGDDTFVGSAGNDTIEGGAGFDTLDFSAQSTDLSLTGLRFDYNNWTYISALGNDRFLSIDQVMSGSGNDTITVSSGNANIISNAGNDTITSTSGRDTIESGTGDDSVNTSSGDDLIIAGAGNDTYNGSSGNDLVDYASSTSAIDVNLATGAVANDGFGDVDSLVEVEAIAGSDFNDKITGSDANNYISGRGGNDTLDGGAGNDFLVYAEATSDHVINLTTGVVTNGTDTDTATNFEHVSSGSGDDIITGTTGYNALWGGEGDDTLDGGAGADDLVGGAGNDVFIMLDDGERDSIYGGAGFDILDYSNITFDLSENLSDRGFYNYSLRDISYDLSDGRSNDDADDIIYGIEGIIGGSGNDTLRFTGVYQRVEDNAFSGVYLDGFSGDDSLQGNRGDDTLIGGLGNDTLSADSADDWLDGGVGDDSMHAGNGNDTIMSNDGVDTIDGSGNTDYIDFSLATNAVEVDLTQDDEIVNDGFGNAESIVNIEGFIGSNFADTFTGDASSQIFINSAGNDTFDGGDGSDTLDFTGLTAAVTLNTATGTVSSSASGTDTFSNLEVFNTGAGNDTLTGSDEAETFNANAGNDSITAGAGNDTIIASTGNDTIVGGADTDTLTFATADTSITVDLSDTSAQSTGLGAYVISGVENIIGSNTSDDLVGDSADNEIAAGSGDDTVSGNAGDDTLSGNDGDDVIYGNAGDDYLSGDAGNDSLYGGAGNDTLEGDAGIDFLSGGDGDDTFNNLNQTGVAVMHGDAGNDIFMMTANSSENADFDFDGGTGVDTVEISTNNAIYDFNNRPNERFENIEILSLATGTQLVRLDNVAVQNMTAATNAAVDNATYNTQQILVVSSDDGADTLYLTGQEWVTTGETTTVNGGTEEYTIYQFGNRDVFVATNTLTSILNNTADDSIIGVSGIDSLAGGVGNDTIQGLAGDDTINGGRDDDILDGGAGVDTLSFEGQTAKITVDLNITTAQATGEGNDIIVNFEQVQGGSGADNLTAHANGSLLSGNAGHDSLYGDVGEDTLLGGADNDVIRGGAGNDSIDGGTYNDMLFGEDGDDTILGGEGTDSIYGGTGVDSIDAGNDDDVVEAGDGDDIVLAGAGNDTVLGQAGADSIRGLDGNDTLSGGTGNDTIEGDNGNDYILGLEDNDSLVGGNGNDTVDGGAGNDVIYGTTGGNLLLGGVGIDTIIGGNQSDTIRGGTGDDSLNGGAGIDVLDMSDSTTAFSFTVADNTSIVSSITDAVLGTDSIVNFEGIIGGSGADTLTGGTGSDIIGGGLGNDILDGGAGVDTLDFSYATQGVTVDFSGDTSETSLVSDGQGGTDTVINFENLNGGAGNDYFAGSNVANTASGFVGDDTLIGNAGNDTLYGGDGNDSLSGGEGQDSLYGESGNDTLSGGADIDRIYGGDGNDSIDAGEGNDSIWGDAGNDTLEGGIGRDSIWGGAGNDTLVGTQDNDFDRYYGEAGTDILDLSAITVDINVSTYNGNYTTSYINYSGLSRDEAYNIEGVILGSGNDNFQVQYIVNYENIYVDGGAGNDTISSLNWDQVAIIIALVMIII